MTLWGGYPCGDKIITLPKKIVTSMVGTKPTYSCRGLHKRMEIFTCNTKSISINGQSTFYFKCSLKPPAAVFFVCIVYFHCAHRLQSGPHNIKSVAQDTSKSWIIFTIGIRNNGLHPFFFYVLTV
jgi:hypothetical protein